MVCPIPFRSIPFHSVALRSVLFRHIFNLHKCLLRGIQICVRQRRSEWYEWCVVAIAHGIVVAPALGSGLQAPGSWVAKRTCVTCHFGLGANSAVRQRTLKNAHTLFTRVFSIFHFCFFFFFNFVYLFFPLPALQFSSFFFIFGGFTHSVCIFFASVD